jgi:hypothetical protein
MTTTTIQPYRLPRVTDGISGFFILSPSSV